MMRNLALRIDAFNAAVGHVTSFLVYVMIAVIIYEVTARFFFNAPTTWAHDVSGWLQVGYVFLGGAWALQKGYLVRVDVLYQGLSVRMQAAIDLVVSTTLLAVFAYIMITKGWGLAYKSFEMGEVSSNGAWQGRVYPAKFMIPLGMALLSLSWFARCIRQAIRLVDPDAIEPEADSGGAGQ